MSEINFWDNFKHGFKHGVLNSMMFPGFYGVGFRGGSWGISCWNNPFMGFSPCLPSIWGGGFCSGNMLFMTPNFMTTPFYTYPSMNSDLSLINSMSTVTPSFKLPDINLPKIEFSDTNEFWEQAANSSGFNIGDVFIKKGVNQGVNSIKNQSTNNNINIDVTDGLNNNVSIEAKNNSHVVFKSNEAEKVNKSRAVINTVENTTYSKSGSKDKYFDKMLEQILVNEGGYVDHPNDKGGPTNKGITTATYNAYRKKKNLPQQSVKNITDTEVKEIYLSIYKQSGADKIDNPQIAFMYFDVAVNSGIDNAKMLYKRAGNDLQKFAEERRKFYERIIENKPDQAVFRNGWNNRVTNTVAFATKNLPSEITA